MKGAGGGANLDDEFIDLRVEHLQLGMIDESIVRDDDKHGVHDVLHRVQGVQLTELIVVGHVLGRVDRGR